MEYCAGGDLANFYKDPSFTRAEFCRIALELLSGVCYLHEKGIAHR